MNRTSLSEEDWLLPICWLHQSCHSCHSYKHTRTTQALGKDSSSEGHHHKQSISAHPCVWCPGSGTCVPNLHSPQLLSPIWDKNVCPGRSERFELRTHGLGCGVSTVTFLSVWVSVLGTVLVALGIWAIIQISKWLSAKWSRHNKDQSWSSGTLPLGMQPFGKRNWWGRLQNVWLNEEPAHDAAASSAERSPLLPDTIAGSLA